MTVARAEAERLAGSVHREPCYAGRRGAAREAAAFGVTGPVTEQCLATAAEAGPEEKPVTAARVHVPLGQSKHPATHPERR